MKLILSHCTCVLLFMAAVTGGNGASVWFWLMGGLAFQFVCLIRLTVAVGGQTAERGGATNLPPAVRQPGDIRLVNPVNEEGWWWAGLVRCVCVCGHLRLESGRSGSCWRRQSLSLMLSVSSGASRHTKIQLMVKSVKFIKNSPFNFSLTVQEMVRKHISPLMSSSSSQIASKLKWKMFYFFFFLF